MITMVLFQVNVAVNVSKRENLFAASDGWTIVEGPHGRIQLTHATHTAGKAVVVQGFPYSLVETPDVPALTQKANEKYPNIDEMRESLKGKRNR